MRILLTILLLLPLAACGLDHAWGPDGARYYGDTVECDFNNGLARSWEAAQQAARNLDMPVDEAKPGLQWSTFTTAFGETTAAVRVEADTSAYSFIQIRIGRDQDPEITTPFLRELERLLRAGS